VPAPQQQAVILLASGERRLLLWVSVVECFQSRLHGHLLTARIIWCSGDEEMHGNLSLDFAGPRRKNMKSIHTSAVTGVLKGQHTPVFKLAQQSLPKKQSASLLNQSLSWSIICDGIGTSKDRDIPVSMDLIAPSENLRDLWVR